MKSPTVKIQTLLKYLSDKDEKIGQSLLDRRDFDSLKELIDSAVYLTEKNQNKEVVPDKYKDLSLEGLLKLKVEVDNYCALINVIFNEPTTDDTELINDYED